MVKNGAPSILGGLQGALYPVPEKFFYLWIFSEYEAPWRPPKMDEAPIITNNCNWLLQLQT